MVQDDTEFIYPFNQQRIEEDFMGGQYFKADRATRVRCPKVH